MGAFSSLGSVTTTEIVQILTTTSALLTANLLRLSITRQVFARALIQSECLWTFSKSCCNQDKDMAALRHFKIGDGRIIPGIGFGTGTALYQQDAANSLVKAISVGYRHLDTAQMYQNESSVGKGIKASGVDRSQLFITTKVSQNVGQQTEQTFDRQLADLELDHVDLYLIHTPILEGTTVEETWKALESIQKKGKAKSIGVSNFRVSDLKRLEGLTRPAVNQIEFHPYVWKKAQPLYHYCRENNIALQAYGPLSPLVHFKNGPLDPVLKKIAERHQATEGQVLMAWTIAKGVIPVTTSNKEERMKELLKEIELSEEEQKEIEQVGSQTHHRKWMDHMDSE
ncbi:hypothetical protein PROFUN_03926 [Planoprotostelium fungivorum]|uniref:NADP-dependent oxidoreductase domain-containing protein n=1 Tax=Planoprotostelium fungivorum TaxID=1890364 RepID=A0A2P6MTP6_9EUKA|nr:hypothetical protein PROFUN_03926 [Planoprotostelium fungivorum]